MSRLRQVEERPYTPSEQTPESDPPVNARVTGLQGYGFVSLAVVIIIAALSLAQGFFVPVVVAIVLSLALGRVVRRLQRFVPRWIAAAVVVLVVVAGIGAIVYTVSDEATRAVAELPTATKQLRQAARVLLNRQSGPLSQMQRAIDELEKTATETTDRPATPSGVTPVQVVEPPFSFGNVVWLGSTGVVWVVGEFTLVLFLVYFLLAYGDMLKRKLVLISGDTLSRRKVTLHLIDEIGESVAKSISHLTLTSVVVGVVTAISLALMNVNYAGLWGLAAGLFNLVPYIGPLVVAAGLFLASLVQFGDIATAALVAGVSVVITSIEGFVFTPIVFGRAARVNPVAVFVGFLFWGWLWGLWGMLLALPLLMIMRVIAEKVDDLAPLAELLSD
jgi:predicted PurR-regulated permease PerM